MTTVLRSTLFNVLKVDKKGIRLLGRHGDDDVRGWMLNSVDLITQ